MPNVRQEASTTILAVVTIVCHGAPAMVKTIGDGARNVKSSHTRKEDRGDLVQQAVRMTLQAVTTTVSHATTSPPLVREVGGIATSVGDSAGGKDNMDDARRETIMITRTVATTSFGSTEILLADNPIGVSVPSVSCCVTTAITAALVAALMSATPVVRIP